MENDKDIRAKLHFLCREKLYNSMHTAALEGLRRYPTDAAIQLMNGVSLVLGKHIADGIRELEAIAAERELGAMLALTFAHKKCASVDNEAVSQLETLIKEERKKCGDSSFYLATLVMMLLGQIDKAQEYSNRLMQKSSPTSEILSLCGWIELRNKEVEAAGKYFNQALEQEPRNTDAVMGKVRYLSLHGDHEGAISLLNQLIVQLPSTFTLPLVERMHCHLALYDWEQCLETANRILTVDPHCPEALKHKILVSICRDGDYEGAALSLHRFLPELERREPKGTELLLETAQLFSRSCGRDTRILDETYRFVERAVKLTPGVSESLCELGKHSLMRGKITEAIRFYRSAIKADEASATALIGLSRCLMEEGGSSALEQAKQQVEFLREIQGASPHPDLLLLQAQILSADRDQALSILNEAIEVHLKGPRTIPFSVAYICALDPDFLIQVVHEYLMHSPMQISGTVESTKQFNVSTPLKQAILVLEAVSKACPGLLEGLLLLAKVRFLAGDIKGAMSSVRRILDDVDVTCAEAHLLQAQIHIGKGEFDKAAQSLEVGLSYNFKVRDHPLYHLITALVQKHQCKFVDSIPTLRTAIEMSGTKDLNKINTQKIQILPLTDKVTLYTELADSYSVAGQIEEAAKLLEEAIALFGETSEVGRVTMSSASLSLARGEVATALEILATVGPGMPYYQQAHCKMADIHLKYRGDRRSYAECYRRLVEHAPGPVTFSMLGDALMQVPEPDRALEAYEQALKRSPRDTELARKVGHALVKAHQYGKAVNYYREALKAEDCGGDLKLDMAELHTRLRQYEKAEKLLVQELESCGKTADSDIATLEFRTKLLLLLAKVRERSGDISASLATLREARDNQSRLLRRISDGGEDQHEITANICKQMAEHASSLRDHGAAIQYYKESIVHKPYDQDALVALARLYMQVNDLEQCQQSCSALIKTNPDHEAATVMMADLAFRRVDFDTAAVHFQQLLDRRPTYWTALARLVEVMRRTGNLQDVKPYLTKAAAVCQRSDQEAGLCYCKGLFEWYSGNFNSALHMFNGARRDQEWGQQAVYNMIEICLDQDGESFEDDSAGSPREMALSTAERLLTELKPRPGGISGSDEALNHRLLGNFLLIASRQKPNTERALQDLTSLASQETFRDHPGVSLALATAYINLKQTPRARNQLKRVARSTWTFEEASYLERCWLALAEMYVNGGSAGAEELLSKVLKHNRACAKAYELAGLAAEKEQRYRDAATQYEQAWIHGGKNNPTLGYKLAFNYMKSKRFVDAIDVSQQVLKVQPDYPRIRKEILEKSRNNLRS